MFPLVWIQCFALERSLRASPVLTCWSNTSLFGGGRMPALVLGVVVDLVLIVALLLVAVLTVGG